MSKKKFCFCFAKALHHMRIDRFLGGNFNKQVHLADTMVIIKYISAFISLTNPAMHYLGD